MQNFTASGNRGSIHGLDIAELTFRRAIRAAVCRSSNTEFSFTESGSEPTP